PRRFLQNKPISNSKSLLILKVLLMKTIEKHRKYYKKCCSNSVGMDVQQERKWSRHGKRAKERHFGREQVQSE
ncbi:MAG: hypothetical protein K2K54_08225, partial [Lachnospiraceae bacterium]|nr:hypothetical protein [Lachnospiraceae bacterium]